VMLITREYTGAQIILQNDAPTGAQQSMVLEATVQKISVQHSTVPAWHGATIVWCQYTTQHSMQWRLFRTA
jgi:hypothetical protein